MERIRIIDKTMVSIIVPTYNVEKYLPQCIESLINQTYHNIEIILVDDGSPDRCGEICNKYAEKDKRIKVIHQENKGVSAARNAGIQAAQGDFIGFADPDDWTAPDMYAEMQKAMLEYHTELVICGYEYCHEDGSIIEQRRYRSKPNETLHVKELMRRMSDIPPTVRHTVWNKLFRKDLIQGILFPEHLRSSEDVWFLTEYLKKVQSAVFLHKPYYFNRVRQGSATHGGLAIQSLADSFRSHEHMYQSIIKKYPELKNYSQAFLLDVCLLKYNEAKKRCQSMSENERKNAASALIDMKKYLRNQAWRALFNPEIYWKTRIAYLIIR